MGDKFHKINNSKIVNRLEIKDSYIQSDSQESVRDPWYKRPLGIIIIGVVDNGLTIGLRETGLPQCLFCGGSVRGVSSDWHSYHVCIKGNFVGIIRKTVQRQIYEVLDNSVFTSHDFVVKFGDDNNKDENLIYIEFSYNPALYFSAKRELVSSNNILFLVTRTPGDFEVSQSDYVSDYLEVLNHINIWCSEVRDELKAEQPIYSELDKLRETIEEHISLSDSESEFSAEDIFTLKKSFEELEKRVENLEKEKSLTEKQAEEFKEGINQVVDDLEFYPKKTWVKTATNKISKITTSIGKTKEGREILADGAKKLLGLD